MWPPFRYHLLVHLSFALWFLMRPEGVVGWAALSLDPVLATLAPPGAARGALPRDRPLVGAYKRTVHRRVLDDDEHHRGQRLDQPVAGPNHQFRWQTADESYFEFESHLDAPPRSKRASDLALREVARFAATYPVYVAHVALHKFVEFVDINVFNAAVTYPRVVYERLRGPAVWFLMGVVALSLVLPYEGRRTLFLGWPLVLQPAAVPVLLLRRDAPRRAGERLPARHGACRPCGVRASTGRSRAPAAARLGVAAAFVAAWFLLHWADQAFFASDRWRYWTPFLDPAPFAWYLR